MTHTTLRAALALLFATAAFAGCDEDDSSIHIYRQNQQPDGGMFDAGEKPSNGGGYGYGSGSGSRSHYKAKNNQEIPDGGLSI